MNSLEKRIKALSSLGRHLKLYSSENEEYKTLHQLVKKASVQNGWFTEAAICETFKQWGKALNKEKIQKWVSSYRFLNDQPKKTVALILAGNIPLVGFHDLICVWISGNRSMVKCASKDTLLLPYLMQFLDDFIQEKSCFFTNDQLTNFDAVIATGSNNAARYFDHYFSKYPHIIRKNRNGVAVLTGEESKEHLEALGRDILQYFGLGCRNVAHIFIPKNFDLNLIFGGLYPLAFVIEHSKYANNYDYNKAVYLMSDFDFLDNGFMLLRESDILSAPIACLHYSYYENVELLKIKLEKQKEAIQCLVSNLPLKNALAFGTTQQPELWDYADNVDTLQFLIDLP